MLARLRMLGAIGLYGHPQRGHAKSSTNGGTGC